MLASFLVENRIDFLKKQNPEIDTSHERDAFRVGYHKDSNDVIDHYAQHGDPTPNKQYTQWLIRQYKNKQMYQEDAPFIRSDLETFHVHKHRLAEKDINKYHNLDDLRAAIAPYKGAPATNKEADNKTIADGLETIYKDHEISMHRLHTKEASKLMYGGGARSGKKYGTDWCTAADSQHNMFDSYGPPGSLYTFHATDDSNSPYQYHAPSRQFMDRFDRSVHPTAVIDRYPQIHQFTGKLSPQLDSKLEHLDHHVAEIGKAQTDSSRSSMIDQILSHPALDTERFRRIFHNIHTNKTDVQDKIAEHLSTRASRYVTEKHAQNILEHPHLMGMYPGLKTKLANTVIEKPPAMKKLFLEKVPPEIYSSETFKTPDGGSFDKDWTDDELAHAMSRMKYHDHVGKAFHHPNVGPKTTAVVAARRLEPMAVANVIVGDIDRPKQLLSSKMISDIAKPHTENFESNHAARWNLVRSLIGHPSTPEHILLDIHHHNLATGLLGTSSNNNSVALYAEHPNAPVGMYDDYIQKYLRDEIKPEAHLDYTPSPQVMLMHPNYNPSQKTLDDLKDVFINKVSKIGSVYHSHDNSDTLSHMLFGPKIPKHMQLDVLRKTDNPSLLAAVGYHHSQNLDEDHIDSVIKNPDERGRQSFFANLRTPVSGIKLRHIDYLKHANETRPYIKWFLGSAVDDKSIPIHDAHAYLMRHQHHELGMSQRDHQDMITIYNKQMDHR